jgi:hypothetical protein
VSVVAPLAVLEAVDRTDLALFAVFGAFASVYGRGEPHRMRIRSQPLGGSSPVLSVGLAAWVTTTGAARPWLAVVGAGLLAAAGSLASDSLRWRPAGPIFVVFAFGAISSVPAPSAVPVLRHVLLAVGIAACCAGLSVFIGAVGAVHPGIRRRGPATPPGKLPENRCQAGRAGPPEASMAAPTIPASLRSAAGTMGVRRSSSGRNLSAFVLTPPPTTKRSGQNRFSRVR